MIEPRALKDILEAMPSKAPIDADLVSRAYQFAAESHKDQRRYSGDLYTLHTNEVGYYLAEAGLDAETIAAGLLHDTIEDAGVGAKMIEEKFGPEVVRLVEGVTSHAGPNRP